MSLAGLRTAAAVQGKGTAPHHPGCEVPGMSAQCTTEAAGLTHAVRQVYHRIHEWAQRVVRRKQHRCAASGENRGRQAAVCSQSSLRLGWGWVGSQHRG